MENQSQNDENSIIGKKRQQTQSPFTAATPKSRIGKEPKRLFGPSPLTNFSNAADPNLEETAIESRPCSAVPSEVSEVSDCVDPNLEQTQLIDNDGTTITSKDLSMVSEGDETNADVTLEDTFEDKMKIDEERTPTKTSPSATSDPSTSSVVSAPTSVVSQIQKGLSSWSSYTSPVYHGKPQIDESLHEFMLLEKEVEHNCDVRELRALVAELEKKIEQINESRVFEEQALMQQNEAVQKKAKAERVAAKQKEEELEVRIAELQAKLEEHPSNDPDKEREKEQLEQQLAQLTARIEELTTKALKVEEMQKEMSEYEVRVQALYDEKMATVKELEMVKAKMLMTESQAAEQKNEAEETRKMMLEEMKQLEEQLTQFSQRPAGENEEVQKLKELVARLEDSLKTSSQQVGELETQLEVAVNKMKSVEVETLEKDNELEKLRNEIATFSSLPSHEVLVAEHTKELEALRQMMESEAASLKVQLEDHQKTIEELTSTISESNIDYEATIEKLQAEILHTRQESADSQKTMEMKYETEIFDLSNAIQNLRTELEVARQQSLNEPSVDSLVDAEVLETVRNQLRATEAELSEAREKTESAKKEAEEELETVRKIMIEELQEAEKQNSELKAQIERAANAEEVQKALESSECKIKEMSALLESSRQETEEVQKQKAVETEALETKLKELQTNLEDALQTAEETRKAQEASVAKISEMEFLIRNAEADKATAEELLEGIRNETAEQLRTLQTQLDSALQVAEESQKFKEQAQLESNDQMTKISNLEAELLVVEEKVHAAKLETEAAFADRIQELSTTIETLQSENNKNEELAVAEGKIFELGETIQQQTSTIEALREDAKSARLAFDEKTSDLQQTINDVNGEVETLRAELDAARQKSVADLTAAHDVQKQLAAEFEEAKQQLEAQFATQTSDLLKQLEANSTEKDALVVQISELESLLIAAQKEVDDIRVDENDIQALNARVAELEASFAASKAELAEVENMRLAKETELEDHQRKIAAVEAEKNRFEETVEELKAKNDALQIELANSSVKQHQQQALEEARALIDELTEKLEVAEQAVSQKENAVVTLESRIETMSQQFEQRLTEAGAWKMQAMGMETLNTTVAQMAAQLQEMSARLEASNRRVVEVEETAQHDVTLMREEVDERVAELEMARARIAELEEKLAKADKEIERLEKVCDDFDEDEAELKQKIYELEDQIKLLKGGKPAEPVLGLLQQARLGIKPLSRENSHISEQPEKDDFEDASDSFPPKQSMTMNQTALQSNSPNLTMAANMSVARSSTTMHPDDMADTSLAADTPSKKKANRSNCQQQ